MSSAGIRVIGRRFGLGPLALYIAISFLAFGLRIVLDPGAQYVGGNDDPQIFIWSLAWWPHAIAHGHNPFVTPAIWAPSGVDLAWATSTPALSLVFAPLTAVVGAVAAYNVAAVLMPALSAWTCFLLCRRITGSTWASLAGGYVFGFSSYILGHELAGHLHLTSVFLVPLMAFVILDYLESRIDGRGFAVRFGLVLAGQILLSTEVAASATLALFAALALAAAIVPTTRSRIREAIRPLAGAYALAALLVSPFLYYLLSDFQTATINSPQAFVADVANLVIPTGTALSGRGWIQWTHLEGNIGENGAFLGLPLLLIAGLFGFRQRRSRSALFLVAALGVAIVASFGSELRLNGRGITPLPWLAVVHLPLFDNLLPVRFMMFASLAAAVIASRWAAFDRARISIRIALLAAAILVLVPDPAGPSWATGYSVPSFFTDPAYTSCLDPGEIVLPLPIADGGQADLWQVAAGFRFRLAGGRLLSAPPPPFQHPEAIAKVADGLVVYSDEPRLLARFVRAKGISTVIVDDRFSYKWAPVLDSIATGRDVGGVRIYNFSPLPPSCGAG
ncbi:MAG TPA: hypothetical protein VGM80_10850 [Gaiellaceae bacterium]